MAPMLQRILCPRQKAQQADKLTLEEQKQYAGGQVPTDAVEQPAGRPCSPLVRVRTLMQSVVVTARHTQREIVLPWPALNSLRNKIAGMSTLLSRWGSSLADGNVGPILCSFDIGRPPTQAPIDRRGVTMRRTAYFQRGERLTRILSCRAWPDGQVDRAGITACRGLSHAIDMPDVEAADHDAAAPCFGLPPFDGGLQCLGQ